MRRDLGLALEHGARILSGGGSALDAVVGAVSVLEDSRVFNAARGAVLRRDGGVGLDASVMCGATRRAGAVTLVRSVQNPVQLARAVLERGEEVLLCGPDAEELARESGLPTRPLEYFLTDYRVAQLARLRARAGVGVSRAEPGEDAPEDHVVPLTAPAAPEEEGQTVGAVALDNAGHLAAATSTGGRTNARSGRIGDSPILGAGTWAHDATCALSATGDGEFFLRAAFAHEVHSRLAWRGPSLAAATREALDVVRDLGGEGGCIALDRHGQFVAPFTTLAMPRAYLSPSGSRHVWVLEASDDTPL